MGSTDTEINWTKEHRHQPTSSEQTLAQRREHPYIWTTWLPRLLTGENSSEWAVWFKAHYQDWTRTPSEFNQAEWMLNHTALLNDQKSHWEARGDDVRVEAQNAFRLQGRTATLAGKPDIIVVRDDHALIIDVKAGREQPSHTVQMMIYMYALPRALPQYREAKLSGEVVYPTRTVKVPRGGLGQGFIRRLVALIQRVAAPEPPPTTANASECQFYDLTHDDCPDRVDRVL